MKQTLNVNNNHAYKDNNNQNKTVHQHMIVTAWQYIWKNL